MTSYTAGELLTIREICETFNQHRSTVYRWMNEGHAGRRLAFLQLPGSRLVRRDDLDSFLTYNRPDTACDRDEQDDRDSATVAYEQWVSRELDLLGV